MRYIVSQLTEIEKQSNDTPSGIEVDQKVQSCIGYMMTAFSAPRKKTHRQRKEMFNLALHYSWENLSLGHVSFSNNSNRNNIYIYI